MTYDYELTLLSSTYVFDNIGNQIEEFTETKVLCYLESINSKRFYNVATSDLKAEVVFIIKTFEYDGQKAVKFENEKYSVIRADRIDHEEMSLICEKKVGVN